MRGALRGGIAHYEYVASAKTTPAYFLLREAMLCFVEPRENKQ